MSRQYSIDDLCRLIDHTNLKPDASAEDIKKLCQEAKDYHFKMVAVNQTQAELCAQELAGTDVAVGAAIAFPLGQTSIEAKMFETQNAIDNGATEIDYVINLTEVKNNNFDYIQKEMEAIVKICDDAQIPSKVIFENYYLTDEEKIKLCQIAKDVQPTFIKTSTGFAGGGATLDDVKLMKQHVGDQVKVKAAGGIRDADTFLSMIEFGAERIGCSAGIAIIEDLKAQGISNVEF